VGRGSESNPDPNYVVWFCSKRYPARRGAERIVRSARPNILFYDEHVIDLERDEVRLIRFGIPKSGWL
jgi:hypothetical protein